MPDLQIRKATVDDASLILGFVKELAIYEKAESDVVATIEDIRNSIFKPQSNTHALICSINDVPAGFAVYFYNYSTWLGKQGLYIEDFYVSPKYRKKGIGKKLFKFIANIAVANDCGRIEWSVLSWNEPAINFYKSFGAEPQSEWVVYRLAGKALNNLGK
jgi:GNAT superfamily N-acetyltransferase